MKLFSTHGRVGRTYYFWHSAIATAVLLGLLYLASLIEERYGHESDVIEATVGLFNLIAFAAYFATEYCATVRRLHDLNRPSSQFFLLLIPLYNVLFELFLLFAPGTDGPNRFGDDPLREKTAAARPVKTTVHPKKTAARPVRKPFELREEGGGGRLALVLIFVVVIAVVIYTWQKDDRPTATDLPQVDTRSFISEDSLSFYCARLEASLPSTDNTVKVLKGKNDLLLSLFRSRHGITVIVTRERLSGDFVDRIDGFGFRKWVVPDSVQTEEAASVLDLPYKSYLFTEQNILMQVGTESYSIHYFLEYLLQNVFELHEREQISIQHELASS
jgi:uncharacterized membrane protein YhaH (DUF805 family)